MQPHVDLLLQCAAARPGTPLTLPTTVDWPRFLELVECHAMGPHVHTVLSRCAGVPADARVQLRFLHERTSQRSLLLTVRLLRVLEAFRRDRIPVLTLKGPGLSEQLYGDPAMRDSIDLDLLVRASDMQAAATVLDRCGYRLSGPLAWLGVRDLMRRYTTLTFENSEEIVVDLHSAVAPTDYPCQLSGRRVWASLDRVSVAGREVPVLSRECQFVYLSIHGTRHCWTNLCWISDLAMLATDHRIHWPTVGAIASEADASRAVAVSLRLLRELLDLPLAGPAEALLGDERVLRPFVMEVAGRLRTPVFPVAPGPIAKTYFNAKLAPTLWRGLCHVGAQMKAPTAADAEMLRLPRHLLFLYYPFRAARLAAKYTRAAVE